MAREELAYEGKAWADLQAGGTPIEAADLNNMEAGIADATSALNKVNATVLTYLVASAGDTATTDLNGAPITGPCYVEDLSNGNRWLDKGDGTARVRTGVSVAEYEALRDSVSQKPGDTLSLTYQTFCGMCTNGGKNFEFLIPTKPLAGVRSASYSGKAEIRQNGRYLLGSSEGMADFPALMWPVDNGIKVQWAPASAPSGVANNEVLAVTMTGKVVFG